jgi:hypothetical protein
VAYGVVGDLEWLSIKVTILGFLSLSVMKNYLSLIIIGLGRTSK